MNLQGTKKITRAASWLLLFHAQNGECILCGKPMPASDATMDQPDQRTTFEHLKTKSSGGADEIYNQGLSHWRCNYIRKTDPLTRVQEISVAMMHVNLTRILADMGLTRAQQ